MRNETMLRRILKGTAAFALLVALGACADQPMEVETPTEVQMEEQSDSGECYIIGGRLVCS